MSLVSTLFHTVVTVSIVLKTASRMIASIPQFEMTMLFIKRRNEQQIKTLNSCLNNYLMVVQDWYRTVFRIEDPDPYPLSNGGQQT